MASTLSIAYTATPLAANVKLAIFATRQVSAGINFLPKGAYKLIQVTAAAAASPANIATAYVAKFGALSVGSKIFFRVIPINNVTGLAGTPTESSVIVA